MIAPSRVPGDHESFICGNDAAAKREVAKYLGEWFGWKPGNIIDLGDITNARGTEMFLALWVRLWAVLGTPHFNIQIVRDVATGKRPELPDVRKMPGSSVVLSERTL